MRRVGSRERKPGFGAALRAFRLGVGLPQRDIGRLLGLHQNTISGYELEEKVLTREQITRLGEATGADVSPLMQSAGYEPPPPQPESVAESGAGYEAAPAKAERISDVIELVVRVDRRTGKVLSAEPRAPGKGRR